MRHRREHRRAHVRERLVAEAVARGEGREEGGGALQRGGAPRHGTTAHQPLHAVLGVRVRVR